MQIASESLVPLPCLLAMIENKLVRHFNTLPGFIRDKVSPRNQGHKTSDQKKSLKIHCICYKSTLLMLTGIALSSVRMQRNSPETHIMAMQSMLITHQDKKVGISPL